MWMVWDIDSGRIRSFCMPTMFGVKKYSDALNKLRIERGGLGERFGHDLVTINTANRKVSFKTTNGVIFTLEYSLLYVTPPISR